MMNDRFSAFWFSMIELYGQSWIREHGEQPGPLWVEAIKSLSDERLQAAILVCRDYGDDYCINLSQFMGRAREVRLPQKHPDALPAPKVSKEKQHQNIKKINKAIKSIKSKKSVRNVYLPNETLDDYKDALGLAVRKGISEFDFIWDRLKQNGWTVEKEKTYAQWARSIRYNLYKGTIQLVSYD